MTDTGPEIKMSINISCLGRICSFLDVQDHVVGFRRTSHAFRDASKLMLSWAPFLIIPRYTQPEHLSVILEGSGIRGLDLSAKRGWNGGAHMILSETRGLHKLTNLTVPDTDNLDLSRCKSLTHLNCGLGSSWTFPITPLLSLCMRDYSDNRLIVSTLERLECYTGGDFDALANHEMLQELILHGNATISSLPPRLRRLHVYRLRIRKPRFCGELEYLHADDKLSPDLNPDLFPKLRHISGKPGSEFLVDRDREASSVEKLSWTGYTFLPSAGHFGQFPFVKELDVSQSKVLIGDLFVKELFQLYPRLQRLACRAKSTVFIYTLREVALHLRELSVRLVDMTFDNRQRAYNELQRNAPEGCVVKFW